MGQHVGDNELQSETTSVNLTNQKLNKTANKNKANMGIDSNVQHSVHEYMSESVLKTYFTKRF